ncbi:MAG: cysteine desulfurase [Promicromonosporaceae bacterium]|nr:cysteine desulfurase [Promicromonosporaceae bacterium]
MSEALIYADAAATVPVRREALEAMWPYLTAQFGNPSAANVLGTEAARGLAHARKQVGAAFGARPSEVVFTSGGTEANSLGIIGLALANPRGRHVITSRAEHSSVLGAVRFLERHHGFEVTVLDVDDEGRVLACDLDRALLPDTTLVSIHHANNEIGTVQDVAALAVAAHAVGALFHTDAVQSASGLPVSLEGLGVDALSLSGHKLGAPKGSGALLVRRGLSVEPLLTGGTQEGGRRAGTENVAGAVGLAAAVSHLPSASPAAAAPTDPAPGAQVAGERSAGTDRGAAASLVGHLTECRDELIVRILDEIEGVQLTGANPISSRGVGPVRHPGHASFVFEGVVGDALVAALEERGVIAAGGAACGAQRGEASHVLLALGLSEDLAHGALRLTFSEPFDVGRVASAVSDAVASLRALT